LDALELPDGAAWEAWLAERHDEHREAWLRIAKRHSGIALITLPDALDGALCFGWVDDHRSPAQDLLYASAHEALGSGRARSE